MVPATRSPNGCWTCRLRRKKCDEAKPTCEICTSLALTCHGYGSRPIWMDGQSKEREMSLLVRGMVKTAASQKRRVAMLRRHQNPQATPQCVTPTLTGIAVAQSSPSLPNLSNTAGALPSPSQTSASEQSISHTDDVSSRILNTDAITSILAVPTDDDQASLLMHYLDHVFPLQFPLYQPSAVAGGRGWLLSMLAHTKPLHHAALSLAAYHRQSLFCPSVQDRQRGCFRTEALQQQRVIAIGELRQHLEGVSSQPTKRNLIDNIELLCCMALLISLEVLVGGTESWRMHLSAASSLVTELKSDELQRVRPELPTSYESALSFFASVITWYDILSCATTRLKPSFEGVCVNPGQGFLSLDKVMGCENWAMLLIRDITILEEWKSTIQATGNISLRELARRAGAIEARLEDGLRRRSETVDASQTFDVQQSHPMPTSYNNLIEQITRAFACSALVYLHVVISGAHPELSEMQDSVMRTISALREISDRKIVSTLSWPLCIAGCMAVEDEQDTFRSFTAPDPVGFIPFGNSLKVLTLLEKCWDMRKQGRDSIAINWKSAMNCLGVDVLLI